MSEGSDELKFIEFLESIKDDFEKLIEFIEIEEKKPLEEGYSITEEVKHALKYIDACIGI